MNHKKYVRNLSLILLGLFLISVVIIPVSQLTFFFSDDAYYYFLTAKHIAQGLGSTFDGYNLTNGYHPQWMLWLLPIYYVLPDDPDLALKVILILQAFLAIASINFCFRFCYRHFGIWQAYLSILLLMLFYSPILLMFNGLESALLLFWLFLLIELEDRYQWLGPDASLNKRIWLGVALAGMATSRLDTVFVLVALAILKLLWSGRKNVLTLTIAYIPTVIVFCLCLSPYLLWNYLTFGHFTPISGSIKNSLPTIVENSRLGLIAWIYVAPFLFALVLFLLLAWKRITAPLFEISLNSGKGMFLMALAIGCLIHVLWTHLFMLFGVYQWHFVAYIPVIVIGLVFTAQFVHKFINQWLLLLLAAVGVLVFNAIAILDKGVHHQQRLDAAQWVQNNFASSEGVALSDAGVFAYFNGRATVNLDGLINSYEFQEQIAQGNLVEFLEQMNVRYIADAYATCDETQDHTIVVFSWRGKNYPEYKTYRFIASPKDAIYRSEPMIYRPLTESRKLCFSIWPINKTVVEKDL